MRRWLVATLLLWSLVLPVAHAAESDVYSAFFNDTFGDFKEELGKAKAEGKQGVFVFFEMDECPFCHYMKTNVLNQPEVQAYFRQHFINLPVDINGDVEIKDFQGNATTQKKWAEANRVRATPVLAFFDLEGNLVHRFTGRTSSVEEFMRMGDYVASGAYKQQPFSLYKKPKKDI